MKDVESKGSRFLGFATSMTTIIFTYLFGKWWLKDWWHRLTNNLSGLIAKEPDNSMIAIGDKFYLQHIPEFIGRLLVLLLAVAFFFWALNKIAKRIQNS